MPSIKDFEKKKKAQEIQKKAEHRKEKKEAKSKSEDHEMETPKRRPSKETHEKSNPNLAAEPENVVSEELKSHNSVEDKDTISSTNAAGAEPVSSYEASTADSESSDFEQNSSQIHIEFPGSFILRSKFGKTFEAMDKVATDWVNDGDFEGLPVGHPLLQIAAAKSLKKAKELEKKAQNTQAYALAKIGFEYAKSKLKK